MVRKREVFRPALRERRALHREPSLRGRDEPALRHPRSNHHARHGQDRGRPGHRSFQGAQEPGPRHIEGGGRDPGHPPDGDREGAGSGDRESGRDWRRVTFPGKR